jgi:hypothetical protein
MEKLSAESRPGISSALGVGPRVPTPFLAGSGTREEKVEVEVTLFPQWDVF